MLIEITIVAALLCSIIIPFGGFLISKRQEKGLKLSLGCNIFFFFATLIVAEVLLFSGDAFAAEETVTAAATVASNADGLKFIAAALSTGMATIGAGIAVASAASAALGALSEDSSVMGKALIFVALAEGIAIYGVLISFLILNN